MARYLIYFCNIFKVVWKHKYIYAAFLNQQLKMSFGTISVTIPASKELESLEIMPSLILRRPKMLIELLRKNRPLNFKAKNLKYKLLAALKDLEVLRLMINADIAANWVIGKNSALNFLRKKEDIGGEEDPHLLKATLQVYLEEKAKNAKAEDEGAIRIPLNQVVIQVHLDHQVLLPHTPHQYLGIDQGKKSQEKIECMICSP